MSQIFQKISPLLSPLRKGLSLRASLLVFLILPLIACLCFFGQYTLRHLEDESEKRMQEDIEIIARAIRGSLEYALERERQGTLSRTLSSVFGFERVYGAYVYDSLGRQIAASGPGVPAQNTDTHLAHLAAQGDRKGEYQNTGGTKIYSYFVPLVDSVGRNAGLLQVTREQSNIHKYIERVRNQALQLLIILSFFLLGIVLYGHHRVIGRNLKNMVRSMARIEQGERSHRVTAAGPRELRSLSKGMNAMLDSLERSRAEIEHKQARQRELERRLQQSQKLAAVGELAAGVAHEIGTPLSVIAGKAQRMLRNKDLPPLTANVFHEIRDAVQRMECIVRQLLDSGKGNPLKPRLRGLDEIVQCAAGQLAEKVREKSISLQISGPRPAPKLEVDSVRIEQALMNLLLNAVHAAGPDGLIHAGWFEEEDQVGFFVADNGAGISEEHRSRITQPFFTTKSSGQGTGLGLSVVQAAVNDHNGQMTIGSSQLGGALFTLRFERFRKNSSLGKNHAR